MPVELKSKIEASLRFLGPVFWLALCLVGFVLVGALDSVLVVIAQPPNNHPTQFRFSFQTVPGAIPTSPTDVIATCATGTPATLTCLGPGTDAYVCAADITGTGQTITIQDKQPTPVIWITGVQGAVGSSVTWPFMTADDARCRTMPGGVTWSASGTGATGWLLIKHN